MTAPQGGPSNAPITPAEIAPTDIRGDAASPASHASLGDDIKTNLPYLRRYARALTGSRDTGDQYAMATLEAVLADPSTYPTDAPAREALFQVFHAIWTAAGAPISSMPITSSTDGDQFGAHLLAPSATENAQAHLSSLTRNTREALLLHTVEDFAIPAVARIIRQSEEDARALIALAYTEMAKSIKGRVMIIEDEALIATDLEGIVADMGHDVTGIARTEREAIALATDHMPDLILSDVQLADNSSGIDAVGHMIARGVACPVVFITAYPERLLTGEGAEPVFLISKPYSEEQVRSSVSQAMFFKSTQTLHI